MDAQSPERWKVALVWRGARPADGFGRFEAVADALAEAGLAPEPCPYAEEEEAAARAQLLASDAALVWVNPLQDGRRRTALDALLREAAAAEVLVSGHPDVIDRMGVKAVLWRTREMGWGSDVRFYETAAAFDADFPRSMAAGPRVLKPNRGNGGQGIWKVEAVRGAGEVRVQSAEDDAVRTLPLADFMAERRAELADCDGFVDQAFQARVGEGMVRCYMAGGTLAGFGAQKVQALATPGTRGEPRLYSGPEDARFPRLRAVMEAEWTPQMAGLLGLDPQDLPAIWDADFLLGPRDSAGEDGYVLCEINASSVFPIPPAAAPAIAQTIRARLSARSAAARRAPLSG
ncbi:Cj0069 family protein [Phenylobacterium sp.]|uniref:Cj0069 family protein n=1 Tax=Phenylobacterium sp. TaxID=1871053 RepID=UPI002B6FC99F|nr:Cj0069 family protein [Phenylobacterium sp.]HVI33976.1 Cj0069 family protein [Phenylobacterium sp.]